MLDRYLADLDVLRSDPDSLPVTERAVAVLDRESGSRWWEMATIVASIRNPVAGAIHGSRREHMFAHVWRSAGPVPGERSWCSFPVEVDAREWPGDTFTSGAVVGHLEPGRAAGVRLDGCLLLPIGPVRPLVRGAPWRPG